MRHLTLADAAEALQLSVPTLKRYIYDGTLKSAKLPGGQHRIPESEIARLLSDGGAPAAADDDGAAGTDRRTEVLEHWVSEIQADMDRVVASLEVLSNYCGRAAHPDAATDGAATDPSEEPEVVILGPGCRRCDALYEQTVSALRAIGRPAVTVERVKDLEAITDYGPVLTPALVVGGTILASGRVPSAGTLRRLLERQFDSRGS